MICSLGPSATVEATSQLIKAHRPSGSSDRSERGKSARARGTKRPDGISVGKLLVHQVQPVAACLLAIAST